MKLAKVIAWLSYNSLRACVLVRDIDIRKVLVLWHGLRNGAWHSIRTELFPEDRVLDSYPEFTATNLARDNESKHILIIDRSLPRFDRDAGSRASWQYIQLFREMGLSVTVWGHDYLRREPYASKLEAMGVRVLYGWKLALGRWRLWVNSNAQDLDYVVLQRPNVASFYIDYIRSKTKAHILYFGVDLRWLRNQRRFEIEGHSLFSEESHYWQSIERDLIRKADCSYYYSNVEVDIAANQVENARVRALPLFLYRDIGNMDIPPGSRGGLMFIGGFAHQPNVDGILWFVNDVLPLIHEHLGDIPLRIVGAHPPLELRGRSKIELLGNVSDEQLSTLYRQTRVVVAPLRYGAGIKGKVVEALFHRVPLVTTTIGAEGLPSPQGVMDVCDLPTEFSERVIQLYVDDALWVQREADIKTYLAQHFSPESARQTLMEVIS